MPTNLTLIFGSCDFPKSKLSHKRESLDDYLEMKSQGISFHEHQDQNVKRSRSLVPTMQNAPKSPAISPKRSTGIVLLPPTKSPVRKKPESGGIELYSENHHMLVEVADDLRMEIRKIFQVVVL